MRKIIILCALALFLPASFVSAEVITGCDFDADNIEDSVRTRGCRTNPKNQVLECKNVIIKLSTSEKRKQNIAFKDFKAQARKRYSNIYCQDGQRGSNLIGTNRRGVEEVIKKVKRTAPDGIEAVCDSIRSLRSCEIWKSEASEHIPSFDPRSNSSSLIALRGCPGTFTSCINIYDRDGNIVHKLGEYPNSISSYDSRHYGGTGCGDQKSPGAIAALARKNTGSSEVYAKDAQGTCARIPEPTRCYNSSKC